MKSNAKLKGMIQNAEYVNPINPRDSLFGGRCNASILFKEVEGDEEMRYYDVNSLYPYVCKYKRYPVGHPEIINDDFQNIDQYFGLIKCRGIPPKNMIHPILRTEFMVKSSLAYVEGALMNKIQVLVVTLILRDRFRGRMLVRS